MKRPFILAAAALLVCGLAFFAWKEYRSQQQEAHILTGTIEATKADITPKTSGYIEVLFVKEGDAVTAGTLAARLSRKDLEAAYLRDQAAYESAAMNLTKLQNGNREEEIREAQNQTRVAQAASDKAARDYARMAMLLASDAISRQTYDAAVEARDAAASNLAALQERQQLLESGARAEDLAIAAHAKDQAGAAMAMSEDAVKDLSVYVPLSGVVLTRNFEPGEYVSAGSPIATIADLSDIWVKVYVSSEEMGRIRPGQQADISIDGMPGTTFSGHIKEISDSAEYTPRQSITRNERVNLVFAVKVAIDQGDGLMKPGMPADVVFHE